MSTVATHIPNPGELTATLHARGAGSPLAGGREGDFDALMSGIDGGKKSRDEVREAAEGLVSVAFVLPMMKMMREEPFKTDLFHGGQGEEMFAARLDEQLADRMTRGMNLPVVEAVYERFAGRMDSQAAGGEAGVGREVDDRG